MRKAYSTDMNPAQKKLFKDAYESRYKYTTGSPTEVDIMEVMNAILYIAKTGCQWHLLPHDFPPPTTVNYYFVKWRNDGFFEDLNFFVLKKARENVGRNPEPSLLIIDSQSVRGSRQAQEESGIDGNKMIKGRKRQITVESNGWVASVDVHAANIYDGNGAKRVISKILEKVKTVKKILADGGYRGCLVSWIKEKYNCILEIVKKTGKGFKVIPRRWVVERTIAWLNNYRRLVRDYEKTTKSSMAMIYVASISIMLPYAAKEIDTE